MKTITGTKNKNSDEKVWQQINLENQTELVYNLLSLLTTISRKRVVFSKEQQIVGK